MKRLSMPRRPCPPIPRLGELQSAHDTCTVPNTGSIPAQFHGSTQRGVSWMKITRKPPQGLLFSSDKMAETRQNCGTKTAVNAALTGMFRIADVDSGSVPEPLPWDCITKTDSLSLYQLPEDKQAELREKSTHGVSITSPTWFHSTARFRRPHTESTRRCVGLAGSNSQKTSRGNETARGLITAALPIPPPSAARSGSKTARPSTHQPTPPTSQRSETMRRTFWDKNNLGDKGTCSRVRRNPRVFAVERAHWDDELSAKRPAAGVHAVGKFPFVHQPAKFFQPKSFT